MKRHAHVVKRPAAPLLLDSARQVRAIISPVRQEIVDLLASAGPRSIAEIAALLGRPADGLYFHARRLVAAGILVESGAKRTGRHAAALYDLAGRPVTIVPGAHIDRDLRRVMQAAIRLGARDLLRALDQQAPTSGPLRTLWSGRWKGWLSPAERRRANRLLVELTQLLQAGRPGRGRALQSLTFVWAPAAQSRRAATAARRNPRNGEKR